MTPPGSSSPGSNCQEDNCIPRRPRRSLSDWEVAGVGSGERRASETRPKSAARAQLESIVSCLLGDFPQDETNVPM